MFYMSAIGCPEIILLPFVSMLKKPINFTNNRQVDRLNLRFISYCKARHDAQREEVMILTHEYKKGIGEKN